MPRPKKAVETQQVAKLDKVYRLESLCDRTCNFCGFTFEAKQNDGRPDIVEISEQKVGRLMATELVRKLQECGAFILIK